MIETPKYSPLGRSAHDVARAIVGLPWKADNTVIGEVLNAWVDGFDVIVRVKFFQREANRVKFENMPDSEQELPEHRVYKIKQDSWDRIFDSALRIKELRDVRNKLNPNN